MQLSQPWRAGPKPKGASGRHRASSAGAGSQPAGGLPWHPRPQLCQPLQPQMSWVSDPQTAVFWPGCLASLELLSLHCGSVPTAARSQMVAARPSRAQLQGRGLVSGSQGTGGQSAKGGSGPPSLVDPAALRWAAWASKPGTEPGPGQAPSSGRSALSSCLACESSDLTVFRCFAVLGIGPRVSPVPRRASALPLSCTPGLFILSFFKNIV